MPQPTLGQMKARCNDWHKIILAELAGSRVAAQQATRLDAKARSTALGTLFRWGCLVNGPMERDDKLRTSYPLRFTKRGVELLAALDPIAGGFAAVRRAEHAQADFRALAAALFPAAAP